MHDQTSWLYLTLNLTVLYSLEKQVVFVPVEI